MVIIVQSPYSNQSKLFIDLISDIQSVISGQIKFWAATDM